MSSHSVRREVLLLAMAAFLSYMAEALYSPIYAIYVEQLGGGAREAGIAWGAYMLTLGTSVFVLSRVIDRIKRHVWILYTGFFVAGILSFSYLLIQNVTQLIILQILMGLTWAATNPVWDVYYSLFMDRRYAASQWGLFEGGSRMAVGLGSMLGGLIVSVFGFKAVFILAGMLNVIASVALFLHRKELGVVY